MAKKSGKVAPEAEVEVQATEAAVETEATETKKKNLFLQGVNQKLIRDVKGKDGKDYKSVSFQVDTAADGKPVMGSILVKPGQEFEAKKKGKGGELVPNPGYSNILLGTEGQHYNVSINSKDENGNFLPQRKMTCKEIQTQFNEARSAYQESKKAEKSAKETPVVETAAPSVEAEAGIVD